MTCEVIARARLTAAGLGSWRHVHPAQCTALVAPAKAGIPRCCSGSDHQLSSSDSFAFMRSKQNDAAA